MWRRIEERYERAQQLGAAFKTPTRIKLLPDPSTSTNFVIRISEALKQKTSAPKSSPYPHDYPDRTTLEGSSDPCREKKGNPFLPYDDELWVMDLSETHVMLLNKFNLVDRHVLVVTKAFEAQERPMTVGDVEATWRTLKCMPEGGIAFFNCGPMSGASQPHKHTQIVPLPLAETSTLPPLDELYKAALAEGNASVLDLPFRALGFVLRDDTTAEEIHEMYMTLLKEAETWLKGPEASYNVLWTPEWFLLIPRSKEKQGPCSLNSLGFAGTFFVRSEEELAYIETTGPMNILQGVAYSNVHNAPASRS